MQDTIYAPPKPALGDGAADSDSFGFYVVSPLKAMILFIATAGIYGFYWHYKNWSLYRRQERLNDGDDRDIWPVARAFFSLFFTHALFNEADAYGRMRGSTSTAKFSLLATLMVLLTLAINILSRVPDTARYAYEANITLIILFVPLMFVYRSAQRFINEVSGDALGKSNSRFGAVNIIFIVIGVLFWALVAIGYLSGEMAAAYKQ